MNGIETLKNKVLAGIPLQMEEVCALGENPDRKAVLDAAAEITVKMAPRGYHLCSIINARSGRCTEDCKWCSQSARHHCDVEVYPLVNEKQALEGLHLSCERKVNKYSLVTSGKNLSDTDLQKICKLYSRMKQENKCGLCGSLGLLTKGQLKALKDAGMSTFHCNLETAPSFFKNLCTTHTSEEKMQSLRWAKEVGLEICSGGIIGMGESRQQRIELAFALKSLEVPSIPINVLDPIKGTELEKEPLISDDEILLTVALFRFVNPKAFLRFAGGKTRLSEETLTEAVRVGINAAIVGDMLTTPGLQVDADRNRFIRQNR